MAKGYPTKAEHRKMNLVLRNRRLARRMKSCAGLTRYFQTQMPDKIVANWGK